MNKDQVYTVKIYFLNPVDIISVVYNTLVEIEYEAYTVDRQHEDSLLRVLPDNIRNVVFISIVQMKNVDYWLEYIAKVKALKNCHTIIGAFVTDRMPEEERNKFLMENVSLINFSEVKKAPVVILKKILMFFEAKGRRKYIRTKAFGITNVFFYIKNLDEPVVGKVLNISAYAFSCEIPVMYNMHFSSGSYFNETLLVVNGTRIRTAVNVVGFSKLDPNIFIFKFCMTKMENHKLIYLETISPKTSRKLHNYIRWCLKVGLEAKFKEFVDNARQARTEAIKEKRSKKEQEKKAAISNDKKVKKEVQPANEVPEELEEVPEATNDNEKQAPGDTKPDTEKEENAGIKESDDVLESDDTEKGTDDEKKDDVPDDAPPKADDDKKDDEAPGGEVEDANDV